MNSQKREKVPWSIMAALGLGAAASISALFSLELRDIPAEGRKVSLTPDAGRFGPGFRFPYFPGLRQAQEPAQRGIDSGRYSDHPIPYPEEPSAGEIETLELRPDAAQGEVWKDALNSGSNGGALVSQALHRRDAEPDPTGGARRTIHRPAGRGGEEPRFRDDFSAVGTAAASRQPRKGSRLRKHGGERTTDAEDFRSPASVGGPADPGWDEEDGEASDWEEGSDAGLRARGLAKGFKSARAAERNRDNGE